MRPVHVQEKGKKMHGTNVQHLRSLLQFIVIDFWHHQYHNISSVVCYPLFSLPHHSPGPIPAHQGSDLVYADTIEVSADRVLQAARRDGKFESLLVGGEG